MHHPPINRSVTIREGALAQAGELLARLDARRVFLVVDEPAYAHSGAAESLADCLRRYATTRFSRFALNPKIEDAEEGIVLFRREAPDAVIALGGGSALDMAKLISIGGVQDGDLQDYVSGARVPERPGPPVIAVPTTAGTGSEATHFAVIYVDGRKYSLAHPFLLPEYALIDPVLTHSLPVSVTASSGLDALCQAAESIWASGATPESIDHASQALSLAIENLEAAVNRPSAHARMAMATAAHFAGKAINISKTTAPHALSYGITTRYGVPHGAAVALTIGAFLGYNYAVDEATCNDARGAAAVKERVGIVVELLGGGSLERAKERLRSLIENIGASVRLRDVGVPQRGLPELARTVNLERLSNNPRTISAPALVLLLEELW